VLFFISDREPVLDHRDISFACAMRDIEGWTSPRICATNVTLE
jgi:hypothetical protein